MKRVLALAAPAGAVAAFLVLWAGTAAAGWENSPRSAKIERFAEPSGTVAFGDVSLGTNITECPQAGETTEPEPVARIERDEVWRLSERGGDTRASTDYSCFPQNETTIDVNPQNRKNLLAGQNDYRNGFPFTGFAASSDDGRTWYDGIIPFPSTPAGPGNAGFVPSGGDPAVVFDRGGTAYMAQIAFWRHNDDNAITVARSTNGGFTWSRACVAINVGTPTDDQARCGGPGDPRQPGDGAVRYDPDNNNNADFSVTFNDKEYIGPDRVYVTWTAFNNATGVPFAITSSTIELSYSDDRGRSWSPKKTINGNAPFCVGAVRGATFCDDNQYSVPTVSPHSGHLYVAFENFNTPDENQWLVVRSKDGGETFEGPFFVTPVFDVNLRGRPDCVARGSASAALTNTCFRVPQTGAIQADKRGGAFADDLYLVMSDNRNGTRESTNTDVFFFKSLDGGSNWIGPTRVNDDPSGTPANRDCGRDRNGDGVPDEPPCPAGVHTGNDNWWPWLDINDKGDLNVTLKDRRLDTDSMAHEWPTSRQRPGNYLVWTWGANCDLDRSTLRECVAAGAAVIPQPTAPINPGPGPVPGSGPTFVGPFENFGISDVPSNFDYCFRAGIFCGDYESAAVEGGRAYTSFTDARNGRSSGGPAGGTSFPSQPGRNPACEQSDAFVDSWSASGKASGQNRAARSDAAFLVTPCPGDTDGDEDDDDDD